jgi:ATP-dependent exoDNAse (exonuclease V) beta subunit
MLAQSSFLFYNAAAGSGKTYTLSKTYLKKLFESRDQRPFRKLLAITFTNKAVAEMKDRILQSLWYFSDPSLKKDNTKEQLLKDLCKELNQSESLIRKKAQSILGEILHNYSNFELTTIDTFTHRIIRSFALDLDLNPGFEVTLDPEENLKEAIELLIEGVEKGSAIEEILLQLIREKIADGKSWDIGYTLLGTSKDILLKEGNTAIFEKNPINQSEIQPLRKELSSKIEVHKKAIQEKAEELLELILNDQEGEPYKKTIRDHLKTMIEGSLEATKLYKDTNTKALSNGTATLKNKPYDSRVLQTLEKEYPNLQKELFELKRLQLIDAQVGPYALLKEISQLYQSVLIEQKLLPIAEFNRLISNAIADQFAPYIYERLGERYESFFIDEFQDTSRLQWNNLQPLLSLAAENAYEEDRGLVFIVGDAKQAIYRWRGGAVDQFLDIAQSRKNPFSVPAEVINLSTNYRSSGAIIQFNNHLFTAISERLLLNEHQTLYRETSAQETPENKTSKGIVSIRFNDKGDSKSLDNLEGLSDDIQHCLDKGYDYKDFAILVSTHKEGAKVIEYLNAQKPPIPFVSADVLKLGANSAVQALVAAMRYFIDLKNGDAAFDLARFIEKETNDKHQALKKALQGFGQSKGFENYLRAHGVKIEELKTATAHAFCSTLATTLSMTKEDTAYVGAFLEELYALQLKSVTTLSGTLEHWDKISDKSLQLPEHLNAVQIVTIHKSKGLEFEIVFFPFAWQRRGKLNQPQAWLNVSDVTGREKMLLPLKKELTPIREDADKAYQLEEAESLLDEINMLYVALTRAEKGLFIYTEPDDSSEAMKFSNLFADSLERHYPKFERGTSHFITGQLEGKNNTGQVIDQSMALNFQPFSLVREGLVKVVSQISESEEQRLGNAFHSFMEEVYTEEDLIYLNSQPSWKIPDDLREWCFNNAKSILNHPQLSAYYQPGLNAKNEGVLIDSQGNVSIPDRVVFEEDSCTIIDYKTGQKKDEHRKQLDQYESLISEIINAGENYSFKKIIVYLRSSAEDLEIIQF